MHRLPKRNSGIETERRRCWHFKAVSFDSAVSIVYMERALIRERVRRSVS